MNRHGEVFTNWQTETEENVITRVPHRLGLYLAYWTRFTIWDYNIITINHVFTRFQFGGWRHPQNFIRIYGLVIDHGNKIQYFNDELVSYREFSDVGICYHINVDGCADFLDDVSWTGRIKNFQEVVPGGPPGKSLRLAVGYSDDIVHIFSLDFSGKCGRTNFGCGNFCHFICDNIIHLSIMEGLNESIRYEECCKNSPNFRHISEVLCFVLRFSKCIFW